MITIGELKWEIVIQKPALATNAYGEQDLTATWDDVYTRWAKMEFKKGKESEIGLERTSVGIYEFTFRAEFTSGSTWAAIIPEQYRVKLSGGSGGASRYFEIEAGGYIGANKQWYKLLCKEKDS